MARRVAGPMAVSHRHLRVIVPWTSLPQEVRTPLDAYVGTWEPMFVGDSPEDYYWLLRGLWEAGDGFVVVEHDTILTPHAVSSLTRCPEPWCAWETFYGNGTTAGLGCAKFTPEFTRAFPDAMELVGKCADLEHPPMHWCRLDWWLGHKLLPARGYAQHVHSPPLRQFRPGGGIPWSSHGCGTAGLITLNPRRCLR